MTNAEMIEKIVSRSGITPQQAEEALRINNWDLLDAMIYVERIYGTRSPDNASHYSTYNSNSFGRDPNGFNGFDEKKSSYGSSSEKNVVKNVFEKIIHNGIIVSRNGKDLFMVPLLFWLLALFSSFSGLLLVMVFLMFFNINYRFGGRNIEQTRLNRVFKTVYAFVQKIKRDLFG